LRRPPQSNAASASGDDCTQALKELVVYAHLEDVLVGTHVLGLGKGQTKDRGRAGCCEDNVLGTETKVIVFKLCGPVIGEGIFQT
jgi:hypothetical protein